MQKTRIIALLVAMLMLATFAVAESADEPIVVKADDIEIHLSEAQTFYDYYFQQYVELFEENGLTFSKQDAEYLRDAVIDALSQNAVMDGKIKEFGLDEITEADKEALRTEVEANYEADLAAFAASEGVDVEEMRTLVEMQGLTVDAIYEQNLQDLPYDRLYDYAIKDVEVTDDEVKEAYDEYVTSDKEAFENDIETYEAFVASNNGTALYRPEGYRYIKQILLPFPADIAAEMIDLETDMRAVQNNIDRYIQELYALENVDESAEAQPREAEAIQADMDEQQAEYDRLLGEYEDKRAQVLPSLSTVIDEITKKYEDGTSFDDLIAEYSEDTGAPEEGVMIHKDSTSVTWGTEFRDTAMALSAVGDVSDPILTDFGVHIIQYAGDVPGGEMDYDEDVAAQLRETLLTNKQDEAYQTAFAAWLEATEIETHPELIEIPELPEIEEEEIPTGAEEEEPSEEANPDDVNEDGSIG